MGSMEFLASEVTQVMAQPLHYPCQGPVPAAPSLQLLLLGQHEKGKILCLGQER